MPLPARAANLGRIYDNAFYDEKTAGSYRSAKIVLSQVWTILQPASVIDVGCGRGAWLKAAQEAGATRIVGIDGAYLDRRTLLIDAAAFFEADLEQPMALACGQSDLVMSMEVAEHLSPARAQTFVSDLCAHTDCILFSAAIPGQGGANHLNEQWPQYWLEKFSACGFACFDVLRELLWDNEDVYWWYAQNVLLFARRESPAYERLRQWSAPTDRVRSIVHPRKLAAANDWFAAELHNAHRKIASLADEIAALRDRAPGK